MLLFATTNSAHASSPDDYILKHLEKGIFIIASKKLDNTSLEKTVIYLIQHSDKGSTGIIINRPTNVTINDAFPDTGASAACNGILHFGGLLHTSFLFMLTKTGFTNGLFEVKDGIYFGTGEAIKIRLQAKKTIDKTKTYAGFMSWGPDQLEEELKHNTWIMTPANTKSIFSKNTANLWQVLYNRWAGSWI